MPEARMKEEAQWKLPEDTLFPARLNKVDERKIEYTIKNGPHAGEKDFFYKWEWEFEITGGEYQGLRAWGDTEDRLTTHPDNKVRQWGEVLLNKTFEIGEGINTDDMLGLPCVITVANTTYEKKGTGEKKYLCPVQDVFPEGADKGVVGVGATPVGAGVADPNDPWASPNGSDEPPF